MNTNKECVLYDRKCVHCGECDFCDVQPDKVCDNCKACLRQDADFIAIQIDRIVKDVEGDGGIDP